MLSHLKIHLRVLRTFLGVKKSAPAMGIKSEFGWLEPKSRAHLKMVRYYLRLQNMNNNRLTKRIFLSDVSKSKFGTVDCWSTEVSNILNSNGLGHYLHIPGNKEDVINSLTNSLLSSDKLFYMNSCLNYPKMRTYVKINDFSENNSYLYKPLSFAQKSFLAKFRIGTLPLRLETGRYSRPPLPENERICLQCSENSIENEIHLTFYCSKHDTLRETLYNKIGRPPPYMSDHEKLKIMVNDPNIVKIFAQYIYDNILRYLI